MLKLLRLYFKSAPIGGRKRVGCTNCQSVQFGHLSTDHLINRVFQLVRIGAIGATFPLVHQLHQLPIGAAQLKM